MVHLPHTVTSSASWRLEADEVTVRQRRRDVVRDFTWSHTPGRIAWMTGENGAGKSSLLRVLAGRGRAAHGTVRRVGPGDTPPTALYYHPAMRLPPRARLSDWERLTGRLLAEAGPALEGSDGVAPPLDPARRLDRLSTGEAKRLLLDVLLRRPAPYVFLDEPYEHLSGSAKGTLTRILSARAMHSVVVVATNQEIPSHAIGPHVQLDGVGALIEPSPEVVA